MFVLAAGGIWLTREGGRIASIWVANAAILSLILVRARDSSVYVIAAAYLGNICANLVAGDPLPIALVLSACNTIEIGLVTALLLRFRPNIDFTVLRDLALFVIVAGGIAPFASALVASAFLHQFVGAPFWQVLENWYAADALGLLVFVPLFAMGLGYKNSRFEFASLGRPDVLTLLLMNAIAVSAIFWQDRLPLLFLAVPPLLLVVVRSGMAGTVIANLTITVIAIAATVSRTGPILLVDAPLSEQMIILQLFLGTCVFISLVFSAYLAEQKRLEERLRQAKALSEEASAAKSAFLSTVSHELRTPLTSIRGSLGLLAGGKAGEFSSKASKLIGIAHNNSERLVHLINDILDMEKIESGKMVFDFQEQSLRAALDPALETARAYLPDRLVKVIVVDDAPGARVEVDVDRLHQVVSNLFSNAIKFSPREGFVQLWLSSDPAEGTAKISVIDQGPGIAEEFQGRLFGKFEQFDSSNTRREGGTGLGLSISKALVEKMGGSISVETEPGKGATFTVTLPLAGMAEPQRLGEEIDGRPRLLSYGLGPEDVFVIVEQLAAAGYGFDHASSFERLAAMLESEAHAALAIDLDRVADHRLGELQGLVERAHRKTFVISADGGRAERAFPEAMRPVVELIAKPIDPARIEAGLREAAPGGLAVRPRILHVEDDRGVLEVVATGLGDEIDVRRAHSLAAAREELRSERFDAVILDLALPDGEGTALLSEIDDTTPVLVYSAAEVETSVRDKVCAVMTKTRSAENDVVSAIHALLASKGAAG